MKQQYALTLTATPSKAAHLDLLGAQIAQDLIENDGHGAVAIIGDEFPRNGEYMLRLGNVFVRSLDLAIGA